MKYKVGDKVKIREDLTENSTGISDINEYIGKVAKVVNLISIYNVELDIDNRNCFWNINWLEPISDSAFNNVSHPKHYTSGKFECIDIMRAILGDEAVKDFCKCNIWKYTYRANLKNGEEDRKKAEWYTEYLIKMDKER